MSHALQQKVVPRAPSQAPAPAPKPTTQAERKPPLADAIALVGQMPIPRDEFVNLLIESRGVAVLEQLIALSLASQLAQQRGVVIDDADVDFEYELALRRLVDPLAIGPSDGFDKVQAERTLDAVLAVRQMSRSEFMLTIRRNAALRKVLAVQVAPSEAQLQHEYELAFGNRVEVRHIQLGNLADVSRTLERLAAGEDFADLAGRFSTNVSTARQGGLLEPFSLHDESIPQAMRQAASGLVEGQVSDAVRIGESYHLLKLEKRVPAESRDFAQVRPLLQKRIEVRSTDAGMRELHERLFKEAHVRIEDPRLRKAFRAAHPDLPGVIEP